MAAVFLLEKHKIQTLDPLKDVCTVVVPLYAPLLIYVFLGFEPRHHSLER